MYRVFLLIDGVQHTDVQGVHPLMQHDCDKICSLFENEKNYAIGIFGSSVTCGCSQTSDLDIAIRLFGDVSFERFSRMRNAISRADLRAETDVLFFNDLKDTDPIKQEIHEDAYTLCYNISDEFMSELQ